MSKSRHDEIAEKIAAATNGRYNPTEGPDIVTKDRVIEVEVDPTKFSEGITQLRGYRRQRYLGVSSRQVRAARKATKGTGVGGKSVV